MSDRNLFRPECAGASLEWHEKCPRCGARRQDNCQDDIAYEVQLVRRNKKSDCRDGYYLNSLMAEEARLRSDLRMGAKRAETLHRIGSSCVVAHDAAMDVKQRMLAIVENAIKEATE